MELAATSDAEKKLANKCAGVGNDAAEGPEPTAGVAGSPIPALGPWVALDSMRCEAVSFAFATASAICKSDVAWNLMCSWFAVSFSDEIHARTSARDRVPVRWAKENS